MGGSKSLMGLTLTVSAVSGIPALLLADVIFRKVGHPNVQFIGFLFYAFRLVGNFIFFVCGSVLISSLVFSSRS